MRHGPQNFPHILSHFYGSPWAIQAEKLAELHRVLWSRLDSGDAIAQLEQSLNRHRDANSSGEFPSSSSPPKAVAQSGSGDESEPKGYRLIGNVALIRISGVISSRPSLFDEWSGGTSHDALGRATDAALSDGKAESIIYDIDSPGGVVYGQPENGTKVFNAQKTKPTKAIANHTAASAAYWYLSQAKEAYVTPSGQVGCIGVITRAMDATEALKMSGIKDILVANASSKYKTEGYPQIPFTEEQRQDMQNTANKYAAMFVEAVAKGRGIRPATVERDFGQGRMLMSEDAVAARMVDGIKTLEELVNDANKTRSAATRRKIAAEMTQLKLPTRVNRNE